MLTKSELEYINKLLQDYDEQVLCYNSCNDDYLEPTKGNIAFAGAVHDYFEEKYSPENPEPYTLQISSEGVFITDSGALEYLRHKIEQEIADAVDY